MRLFVDDSAYYIENKDEGTVLEVLRNLNFTVPSFCVHTRLDIAGNCRMCLIQVNNDLVASCAVNIMPDMQIFTKTKRVFNARDSVLEFLLVNHPLDCPICDQGGSCDLQDLTFIFGSDRGRFYELKKRSVDNLNNCGPLIKTVMTRCIHCTRCVRFLNYFGINELGVIGRGQNMEIGSYINKLILIEDQLSANIIDLCPVGALTSMPYAFTARPWELKSIESIDILDSLASAIRVDVFNNKVMRILPLLDNNVNEEWITNKVRFVYDSFFVQRIYYPKLKVNSSYIIISWYKSFMVFLNVLFHTNKTSVKAFIGPFCDLESCFSIKMFFNSIGCSNLNYYTNLYNNLDFRSSYLLNNLLINLENILFLVLLGTNLRLELPLLNSRIRKSWINSNYSLSVYSFGLSIDYLTYPVLNYSNNSFSLNNLFQNKHIISIKLFKTVFTFLNLGLKTFSYFFIGLSILNRFDGNSILDNLKSYCNFFLKKSSKYSVISPFLGRLTAFEFGLGKKLSKTISNTLVYLSNVFDNRFFDNELLQDSSSFIIFSGSFKDYFFFNSDLILPIPIFIENSLSFLNIEGRYRISQIAINLKNKLYNENQIFKHLYVLSNTTKYTYLIIEEFKFLMSFFYNIISYKCLFLFNKENLLKFFLRYIPINITDKYEYIEYTFAFDEIQTKKRNLLINSVINTYINNYYFTDFFTKNSKILSLCASKSNITSFSSFQHNTIQ